MSLRRTAHAKVDSLLEIQQTQRLIIGLTSLTLGIASNGKTALEKYRFDFVAGLKISAYAP
jgi:hypothetical protein